MSKPDTGEAGQVRQTGPDTKAASKGVWTMLESSPGFNDRMRAVEARSTRYAMARFVRFDEDAEKRHKAIQPNALRRLVTDRIIAIADTPSPTEADDFRLVAWGNSPNSGLVLSLVVYGPHAVIVVYRIQSEIDEIWIQDVIVVHGE
jgi:hypothetical protein